MKKLIIIITCVLTAQGIQAGDLRRELRDIEDQQDEIIEQNEKIAKQNEKIEWQIRKANNESQEQQEQQKRQAQNLERSLKQERSSEPIYVIIEKPTPTPEAKPLPPVPLPSNGLSEEDIKRMAPYFGQFKAK